MIGAFCADIIASGCINKALPGGCLLTEESRYTHNTVLMTAVCAAVLKNSRPSYERGVALLEKSGRINEYGELYKSYFKRYPDVGYGQSFALWATSLSRARASCTDNRAASRVIPIAYSYDTLSEVEYQAKLSCIPSHDCKEGFISAQAVAAAVFMARRGDSKEDIKKYIGKKFSYNLNPDIDTLRRVYRGDTSAAVTTPAAIICFLHSTGYEDAVRAAVSLGGDTATVGCISGGIAEAYYKQLPKAMVDECLCRIDSRLLDVIKELCQKLNIHV